MACCNNPDPAILEKNQRIFCRSCKRYLSKAADPPIEVTVTRVSTERPTRPTAVPDSVE